MFDQVDSSGAILWNHEVDIPNLSKSEILVPITFLGQSNVLLPNIVAIETFSVISDTDINENNSKLIELLDKKGIYENISELIANSSD